MRQAGVGVQLEERIHAGKAGDIAGTLPAQGPDDKPGGGVTGYFEAGGKERVATGRGGIQRLGQGDGKERPGERRAGELVQGDADGGMQGDEVGDGIARNDERGLPSAGGENERFAGAEIDGGEMELETQGGEQFFAKVMVAGAGAAGKQQEIAGFLEGAGFFQEQTEVIGEALVVVDDAAKALDEGGDEGAVGVADLAGTRLLRGGDELAAGGEVGDADQRGNFGPGDAEAGEERQIAGGQPGAIRQEEVAFAGVFTAPADVRGGIVEKRDHEIRFEADIFLHEHLGCAGRDGRAGEDTGALAGSNFASGRCTGLNFGDDTEFFRGIAGGDGIAVHGGAVEGGQILRGADILTQDAAGGIGQRHGAARKGVNFLGNERPGLGERKHAGEYAAWPGKTPLRGDAGRESMPEKGGRLPPRVFWGDWG